MDDDSSDVLPKPDALLALDGVTAELFETLRDWFDVGPTVTLDLRRVDSAVADLGDPQLIAAMAMRKLQALHLLSTPGVRTTTDVVVAMVNDLDREETGSLRRRAEPLHDAWHARHNCRWLTASGDRHCGRFQTCATTPEKCLIRSAPHVVNKAR